MLKPIGDREYDCMKLEDIVKMIGKYVDMYESDNYNPKDWKLARHKLMKWIINESSIRSVLRDYEVRYDMPKWRTDYKWNIQTHIEIVSDAKKDVTDIIAETVLE